MKKRIVEKIGDQLSIIRFEGEPDDLTKAIFKHGDKVSASDECKSNFPSKVAVVDLPFISIGEEELTYAVWGVRDDNGEKWLGFFSENELKFAEGE